MRKMLNSSGDMVDPDLKITGEEWRILVLRCIYAWFRGRRCLYIGKASLGMGRIFHHDVIGKRSMMERTDTIKVWSFGKNEPKDCLDFWEARLIKILQPAYNITHNEHGEYATWRRERIKKVSELRSFIFAEANMAEVLQRQVQERYLLVNSQDCGRTKRLEDLTDFELQKVGEMVIRFRTLQRETNLIERERYE